MVSLAATRRRLVHTPDRRTQRRKRPRERPPGPAIRRASSRPSAAVEEAEQRVHEAEAALNEAKEAFRKKSAAACNGVQAKCRRVDEGKVHQIKLRR